MKFILGRKLGNQQIFEKGKAIPVTVIEAGPCWITQVKTKEKDGYSAVQLGFGESKKITKPLKEHLKKAKISKNLKYFAECKIAEEKLKLGEKITVGIFQPGDIVKITGTSKGKGFAGVIKRHGFHRGPESHGSDHHRRPGSIGASSAPSRVFKGKKMPGRTGGKTVTVKNLRVTKVDPENNLLLVSGAVPGPKKGLVKIQG